ncbi:MAG: deoxyribose-phosphate aldolase [Tychonema bourrellyi B0820]|uniref:Deoxyribose-phosphate aldolase n=1 Tax=Tychonema bourrellyi FEM_GT703 TaxID=2040638 RepID=A0A2G4F009_9CYAN|nr:deoxyribose-phosphate aldolase [Tychonema bourrellyi]MDQ2099733.1 deoxyribose-phosphate aldolase [Tychonema bourrellyi B0820]PHX55094.1 deoxyribose-phosphate aldolase [Tychonema bourrellyi FEM_GT703]
MRSNQPDIDIAPLIDYGLIDPTATPEQVEHFCQQADRFGFVTVCVYPSYVRQAVELLHDKRPKVCTVIGFPTGASTSTVKLYEALEAADNGAVELDVSVNLGLLKAGRIDEFHRELAQICEETNLTIKAIIESSLLSDAEKQLAAEICMEAGVAYIKTNTGFFGAATVDDVRLLKEVTKGRIGIKAAGGIRTHEQALDLVVAGATRLGTSRGPELLRQRDNLDKS